MYIEPDTKIKILQDVPFDNTYRDTVKFASKTLQEDYFSSKAKYTLDNFTYQRKERTLKVQYKADNLYDCNYLMFQNASFGTKWFYAFITNVEYIGNNCSEITFEIDVMQTWQFDYEVKPSFVEREHSLTDNIGENLVTENLEYGEYTTRDSDNTGLLSPMRIVVASSFDETGEDAVGGLYGLVYSGLHFMSFPITQEGIDGVNTFLNTISINNKQSGVVSVFMMPERMVMGTGDLVPNMYQHNIDKNYSDIDGYTPKNKKLFTYPYNFLYCTNLSGNHADFKYEFFANEQCEFLLTGDMSCNPQVLMMPQHYKKCLVNYNEKMVLDGFPQCAYTIDAFQAWLAQNGASTGVNMLGSAFSTAMTLARPQSLATSSSLVGGLTGIASTVAQISAMSALPPQAHGATGSNALSAVGAKDFYFYPTTIRSEYAKIIDDFFSMFGYATHRVKEPNINTRPQWNYVKTIDVCLVGSVPANDMKKICSVFDKGITFWRTPANVGNYNLDNSVA